MTITILCEHGGCSEDATLRCQAGDTIDAMRLAAQQRLCNFHYRELIKASPCTTSRLLTSTEGYAQQGAE